MELEDFQALPLKDRLAILKTTVSVRDVAEMLGLEPDSQDRIRAPWNADERTPSCVLYEDHFFCFATGRWGDAVDLVQAVDPEISKSKAVWLLYTKALRSGLEPGDVERQEVRNVVDFTEELLRYPEVDPFGYWPRTLGQLPPGLHIDRHTLLMPHRDSEGVYGVKTRSVDGSKGAWPGSQFSHRLYHPHGNPTWFSGWPTCIVTEGESDCWMVEHLLSDLGQIGLGIVYALPAGANTWKDHWLETLRPYDRVIVIVDNDQAGKNARDKLRSKIGWDRVVDAYVPQLFNDVRQAVQEGGWDGASLRAIVNQ